MKSKHFLIAGGSSGIGLALVDILSGKGHTVTVISRSAEKLTGMTGVSHIQKDLLTDELDSEEVPDVIHGLAYCPGSITLKPFRSLRQDAFLEDFNINVIGAVKVLHAAQKALKKAENPGVVLFSTVAVAQGMPFHSSIAAAKGAVEGLARSLAAEWAPSVRVNCIAPSLTDTPMASRLLSSEEKKQSAADRHPLRKYGKPEQVASLAAWLLSEDSGWISGQVIGADGGLSTLRV